MIKIINTIIALQLVFVFQIQNVHAGMEKTFQKKAKNMVTGLACDTKSSYGCTLLDTAVDDKDFLNEIVNMILMFTIVLSLVDSKCEVTESGKKLKPKSYTAGITHWIHKLAGLIYIYAEIQNIVTLRKLDKEYEEAAKVEGQLPKLLALKKTYEAKRDAAKKKLKVLKISNIGFGASAAIDIGMSAAFGVWGGYKQFSESKQCVQSGADLAKCAVKGNATPSTTVAVEAQVEEVTTACMAKFQTIATAKTLINTAKSSVTKTVVKGISSAVGGIIGKQITEKAGGGKAAQIVGTGTGIFVGKKVGDKVAGAIEENIEFLNKDGDDINDIVKGQPRQCLQEQIEKTMEKASKNLAASIAVDVCATPIDCPPAIAASCAVKTLLQKEDCVCMVRNAAQIAPALHKMMANLKLSTDLVEDEKILDTMASDANADDLLTLINDGVAVVTTDENEVCGIDYTNWVIRHDLECKPRFDFISLDEAAEKESMNEAEKIKAQDIDANEQVIDGTTFNHYEKTFKNESLKFARILNMDLDKVGFNLQADNRLSYIEEIFNDQKLIAEYRTMDSSEKEKVNSALVVLFEAMKVLKSQILISNAMAEDNKPLTQEEKEQQVTDALTREKEFSSTTNEVTALSGLGLGVVGLFLMPKFMKKGIKLTTVLQRNPMRRGIYYLASYFLADVNVESTETKIKRIDENLEVVDKLIKEESAGQTTFSIPYRKEFFLNLIPISNAHANVISKSLQPLCIKGPKFDLTCECAKTGTCGNSITNFNPNRTELFDGDKTFLKFTQAQISFARKMSTGQVKESDWVSLENTMKSFAPKLNPITAAENLDLNFKMNDLPPLELVKHSKGLVASLRNDAIKELKKFKGAKLDLSGLKASDVYDSLNKGNSSSKEASKAKSADTQKSLSSNMDKVVKSNSELKSKTRAEALSEYNVDTNDVNDNKDLDIFKIIKNRYHKIFFSK